MAKQVIERRGKKHRWRGTPDVQEEGPTDKSVLKFKRRKKNKTKRDEDKAR